MRLELGLSAFLIIMMPGGAYAQTQPTDEDLEQGKRLYGSQCGSCHGPRGNGGKGANLARPRLTRAPDDQALFNVIRGGIPGTEMPSTWLAASQIWQIVAYVRTLGRVDDTAITGDARRGRELYSSLDCAGCHTIDGRGGGIGPELGDVGARRSASHIREALLDPAASVSIEYLSVRALTLDGEEIVGVRINEDAFSIQIRDYSNEWRSLWKNELKELDKHWNQSSMDSYRDRLSPGELDDLIAYLVSLQGSP